MLNERNKYIYKYKECNNKLNSCNKYLKKKQKKKNTQIPGYVCMLINN